MNRHEDREIELEFTIADAVGIGFVFEFHPSFKGFAEGFQFVEIYRKYVRRWTRTDEASVRDWLSDMGDCITIVTTGKKYEIIYNAHDAAQHWTPEPPAQAQIEAQKPVQIKLFDL